ncbi:MAG: hypothetical protein AB7L90_24065 [Hyphomicrobiaceae bacterium]
MTKGDAPDCDKPCTPNQADKARRAARDGVVCSRIRVGEEVLELFAVVVRFDTASDVTLSELRIELINPGNDMADRFFRVVREPTRAFSGDSP